MSSMTMPQTTTSREGIDFRTGQSITDVLLERIDADPAATLGGTPVADLIAACPEEDVSGVRALPDVAWAP